MSASSRGQQPLTQPGLGGRRGGAAASYWRGLRPRALRLCSVMTQRAAWPGSQDGGAQDAEAALSLRGPALRCGSRSPRAL